MIIWNKEKTIGSEKMNLKRAVLILFAAATAFYVFSFSSSAVKEGLCTESRADGTKENILYIKDTLSYDYSELMNSVRSCFGTSNCYVYDGDTRLTGETVNFTDGGFYYVKKAIGNNQTIGQFKVCMFYEADISVALPDGFTQEDICLKVNNVPCVSDETVTLLSEGDGKDIFGISFRAISGYKPVLKVGGEYTAELVAEDGRYLYSHSFAESKSTHFSLSFEKSRAEVILPDDFTEPFYFDSIDEIEDYIKDWIHTATYTDADGAVKSIELSYELAYALSHISADRDGEKQTVVFSVGVSETEEYEAAEKTYTLSVCGKTHTFSFGENITVSKNGASVLSGETLTAGEYAVTVTPDGGRYIKNIYINEQRLEPNTDLSDGRTYSFSLKAESTDKDYTVTAETDDIMPVEVKILIHDKSKFVYEDDPVFTCTVEGLSEGETVGKLVLTREKGTGAGRYRITASYDESDKYNITVAEGYLTVSHDPEKYVTDKAVAAQCGKTGLTQGSHCSGCGESFKKQTVIPAKSHSYKAYTLSSADCTAAGSEKYTCTLCGYSYTVKTGALGHSYSKKYTVDKKATYKASGSKSKHCTRKGCTAKTSVKLLPRLTLSKVTGLKASSSETKLKVTWKKVKGAEKYTAELLSSKGKVIKSVTLKETSCTFKKLSEATVYKVRVRAVAGKNKGDFGKTLTVSTAPSEIKLKSLKSVKRKTATLVWKKQSGVSGYEVQYSASKKLKAAESVTVKKSGTVKLTLKKLKSKKKYYVRVRAYKSVDGKKLYGAWSTVKSVRIK